MRPRERPDSLDAMGVRFGYPGVEVEHDGQRYRVWAHEGHSADYLQIDRLEGDDAKGVMSIELFDAHASSYEIYVGSGEGPRRGREISRELFDALRSAIESILRARALPTTFASATREPLVAPSRDETGLADVMKIEALEPYLAKPRAEAPAIERGFELDPAEMVAFLVKRARRHIAHLYWLDGTDGEPDAAEVFGALTRTVRAKEVLRACLDRFDAAEVRRWETAALAAIGLSEDD